MSTDTFVVVYYNKFNAIERAFFATKAKALEFINSMPVTSIINAYKKGEN